MERVPSMRNDCLRFYSQIRICLEGLWVTRGPRSPIIAPLGGSGEDLCSVDKRKGV